MPHVTQSELQSLRHLISDEIVKSRKFSTYAQQATDSGLKNFFAQQAQQAQRDADTMLGFLQQQ